MRKDSKTVAGRCKECTGLSLNEMWTEPEEHMAWRMPVSCVTPTD